jgi:5-methylcytosine-specific restriction endonuclease McrA
MKRARINSVSAKKRRQDALVNAYKEALYRRSPICSGCGVSRHNISKLDASHIITRGSRPDLITHPDNLVLDCRKCHQKWDSKIISLQLELNNFIERLRVIKRLAPEIYHLRYEGKINDTQTDFI